MRFSILTRRARALIPLMALLLSSCNDQASVRGSYGLRRVEVRGDTTIVRTEGVDERTALRQVKESLRIGAVAGPDEYLFGRITQVRPGPNERLYVWDQRATALRVYDGRTGRFLRQIGRMGDGPGEYRFVSALAITENRVLLRDAGNARISVYDTAGDFVADWRVTQGSELATDALGNVYRGETRDRRAAMIRVRLDGDQPGQPLDTLVAPDLGEAPRTLRAIRQDEGGMETMIQRVVPFLPRPMVAFHPGGFFVGGTGAEYKLELFHRDGTVVRIEREAEPVPVSPDLREALEREISATMRRTQSDWRREGPPIPDRRPYFRDLYTGRDGRLWVRRSVAPESRLDPQSLVAPQGRESPETFDFFEPDGTFCGSVVLPDRARAMSFDTGVVWAIIDDEMGVPFIVRLEVEDDLAANGDSGSAGCATVRK